jgi:hypothetical protein
MPDYFEWRIESRAPNGFLKFPFGDDRNYMTSDEHVEALSSLKVDQWGNCLEASIDALVDDLPNGHLGAVNVCAVGVRYADSGDWQDVYAGVVASPGAPNDYEPSTVDMLGLKKRLYETVVPTRFDVLTSYNPWTITNGDGRAGDTGQVIRSVIAAVIDQLGGPETTIAQNLGGITNSGYVVEIDPNQNSAGELIDRILEQIPSVGGELPFWGVNGKREVFVVLPAAPRTILTVDGTQPGTEVKWSKVDSSKIVSAVAWIGFAIDRDSWTSTYFGGPQTSREWQNFVAYLSQGSQAFGFSAIREPVPENTITGIQVSQTLSYDDGVGPPSFTATTLPFGFTTGTGVQTVRLDAGRVGGQSARVDGVRVGIEIGGSVTAKLRVSRNGIPPSYVNFAPTISEITLESGLRDYWFSSHWLDDPSNVEYIVVDVQCTGFGNGATLTEFQLLSLNTPLLDRIAESRYRFPAPDACTVTLEGVIVLPRPLVEITWPISDTETRTVTRQAQSYEYRITKDGYPTTVIQVGQARDAADMAVWAEIKGRDRRATANANSYVPRGRG